MLFVLRVPLKSALLWSPPPSRILCYPEAVGVCIVMDTGDACHRESCPSETHRWDP